MSELDAGRRANAQPISTSAIGKLRSLSTAASLTQQGEGLDDVFAQVFAHIAQSQPTDVADGENQVDQELLIESNDPVETEDEQRQTLNDQPANDLQWEVDTFVVDPNAEVQAEVDQETAVEEVITPLEIESDDRSEVSVQIVETQPVETDVAENPVIESVAQSSSQQDGNDRRDRGQRDNGVLEAAPVVKEAKSVTGSESSNDPVVNPTQELSDSGQGEFGAPDDQRRSSERGRRLRGRRNGEQAVGANEPTQQARAKEEAILQALGSKNQAGQSTVTPLESVQQNPLDAAGKPANQITHAAAAVSQASASSTHASSSAINGPAGNGNGTTRPLQALEGNGNTAPAAAKDSPNSRSKNASTSDTVSRVKLIQRVSKAFQHLGPEGGTVRLRLAPAELGSVRVEMRIQQRKIQARVVAETEAASAALREHLPELRQRLESQGMQIEQLDVEVDSGEHDARDYGQRSGEDRQQSPWKTPLRRHNSITREPSPSAEVPRSVSQPVAISSSDGVDLRL